MYQIRSNDDCRLTFAFLRQGQICLPMHLYGENVCAWAVYKHRTRYTVRHFLQSKSMGILCPGCEGLGGCIVFGMDPIGISVSVGVKLLVCSVT